MNQTLPVPGPAKIVHIFTREPVAVPGEQAPLAVIEMLERYLAKAKAGELQAAAIAGVLVGGGVSTEFAIGANTIQLVGAVAWLSSRLMRVLNGGDFGSDPEAG